MNSEYDSLLFDMDGTLWDAVDSYCAVWNATIARMCPRVPAVTRAALEGMMGKPLRTIYDALVGPGFDSPYDVFFAELLRDEDRLMPVLGGKLYPGVMETIRTLAEDYKLFMVSNCNAGGLPVFLDFTGLKPYFTDHISYGDTGCDKDRNIALMVQRHGLRAPLYIGDTEGDRRAAHAAGVPFAWAAYGFGRAEQPDLTLNSIAQLPTLIKPLHK